MTFQDHNKVCSKSPKMGPTNNRHNFVPVLVLQDWIFCIFFGATFFLTHLPVVHWRASGEPCGNHVCLELYASTKIRDERVQSRPWLWNEALSTVARHFVARTHFASLQKTRKLLIYIFMTARCIWTAGKWQCRWWGVLREKGPFPRSNRRIPRVELAQSSIGPAKGWPSI